MWSDGYVLGTVPRRNARLAVFRNSNSKVLGRARLVGARWSLSYLKSGSFRTRGYVTKACPGRAAVGALAILVLTHKL